MSTFVSECVCLNEFCSTIDEQWAQRRRPLLYTDLNKLIVSFVFINFNWNETKGRRMCIQIVVRIIYWEQVRRSQMNWNERKKCSKEKISVRIACERTRLKKEMALKQCQFRFWKRWVSVLSRLVPMKRRIEDFVFCVCARVHLCTRKSEIICRSAADDFSRV